MISAPPIVAVATPAGTGALAIIRISGQGSIEMVQSVFRGKDLTAQKGHTLHFGRITDGEKTIDEVLVSVFRTPHSFTREGMCEISCHGSPLIAREIVQLLIAKGAELAKPGEYTQRAFINGRFDLAQAEAVADLINAETELARKTAMHQMRGGFSAELKELREKLIHFASLIELELDFAEEDVEFVQRPELRQLVEEIHGYIHRLIASFRAGNVVKNGVAAVIAGKPNAGKSTLLNLLLNEEKAIVSEIPGTTRDVIEDRMVLDGILFRFIDTAGLRDTEDVVESIGVKRSHEQMQKADLILYMFDLETTTEEEIATQKNILSNLHLPYLLIGNKTDKANAAILAGAEKSGVILMSAAKREGLELLKESILEKVALNEVKTGDTMVTNIRHHTHLTRAGEALDRVLIGIGSGITSDFIAMDIRQALHHLGEITGQITTDDLLENIFSKFCIGK